MMSAEMETEIGPNNNAELYRTAQIVSNPIIDHKHLQFINVSNDDKLLLGASNLTGRFWNGSVWYYDDCSAFEKSKATVHAATGSGVVDGSFLKNKKFVVVEDSGVLQVINVVDNAATKSKQMELLGYTCQHDNSILTMSVFDSKDRVVTGGMDCCLKIWNISELLAEKSYDGAHRKAVTSVDANPKSNDVFASTGLDCEAVVWDIRKDAPAQVVYTEPGRLLHAVAWSPNDENVLVFGDLEGFVRKIDVRQPQDVLSISKLFARSIYRLKFDPKRPHLLAVCCDDVEVKVLDTTTASTVYQDARHGDFVRGIAWCNNDLLTCSWDNTILKHTITTDKVVAE